MSAEHLHVFVNTLDFYHLTPNLYEYFCFYWFKGPLTPAFGFCRSGDACRCVPCRRAITLRRAVMADPDSRAVARLQHPHQPAQLARAAGRHRRRSALFRKPSLQPRRRATHASPPFAKQVSPARRGHDDLALCSSSLLQLRHVRCCCVCSIGPAARRGVVEDLVCFKGFAVVDFWSKKEISIAEGAPFRFHCYMSGK